MTNLKLKLGVSENAHENSPVVWIWAAKGHTALEIIEIIPAHQAVHRKSMEIS